MSDLAQVLVPLLIALAGLYGQRQLPTLDRRVREHTALVKDMPPDLGQPLRQLLEEEVAQLVERERNRGAPLTERAERWIRTAIWSVAALAVVAAAIWSIDLTRPFDEQDGPAVWPLTLALWLMFAMAVVLLSVGFYGFVLERRRVGGWTRTGPAIPAKDADHDGTAGPKP